MCIRDSFWRKHLIRAAGEMPASPEDDFQQRAEITSIFDIGATHKMSELGAKAIYIWEEQSNGDYEIVRTYSSGLIDTNRCV